MNNGWMILILVAVILHTAGTLINNEELSKNLRNAAFCIYGIILIMIVGGVIQ